MGWYFFLFEIRVFLNKNFFKNILNCSIRYLYLGSIGFSLHLKFSSTILQFALFQLFFFIFTPSQSFAFLFLNYNKKSIIYFEKKFFENGLKIVWNTSKLVENVMNCSKR